MTVRPTKAEDLDAVMKIYTRAKQYMSANGNGTQWKEGYPSRELIEADMAKNQSFVCEKDGQVHGVFAFILGEDSTYRLIEGGAWKNDKPYGTIHRIAGDGEVKGIFRAAFEFAKSKTDNVRADTHENNHTMQHLLEKHGFERCGIIYLADGRPRLAYHFTIQ